jgi:hypothetical protein
MRVSEAIALDRDELDTRHGLLMVRHGKFNKSRELVLHPSTIDALRGYLLAVTSYIHPRRVRRCSARLTSAFNLTCAAATLTGKTLAKATTATIRRKLVTVPARIASSARRLTLHLPTDWPGPLSGRTCSPASAAHPPQRTPDHQRHRAATRTESGTTRQRPADRPRPNPPPRSEPEINHHSSAHRWIEAKPRRYSATAAPQTWTCAWPARSAPAGGLEQYGGARHFGA